MSTDKTVQRLIQEVTDLPYDAQTELLESLVAMRSQSLGLYDPEEPNI